VVDHEIGRRKEVAAENRGRVVGGAYQEFSFGLVDDERTVAVDVDDGRDELVVWDSDAEAVG
jgi:hypothetical protein